MSDHLFSSIHHSRHPSLPALNPLFHKSLLSPSSSITHGFKPTVSQILPIADRLRPAGLPSRTDDLVRTVCANRFFGRPFVKRFALCYPTVVCLSVLSCLSVTLVYCSQTVGWIKLKLGMQVCLGPGHIVLDGDPAPPPQRGTAPHEKGTYQSPLFGPCLLWPQSPISATAELLFSCVSLYFCSVST